MILRKPEEVFGNAVALINAVGAAPVAQIVRFDWIFPFRVITKSFSTAVACSDVFTVMSFSIKSS